MFGDKELERGQAILAAWSKEPDSKLFAVPDLSWVQKHFPEPPLPECTELCHDQYHWHGECSDMCHDEYHWHPQYFEE